MFYALHNTTAVSFASYRHAGLDPVSSILLKNMDSGIRRNVRIFWKEARKKTRRDFTLNLICNSLNLSLFLYRISAKISRQLVLDDFFIYGGLKNCSQIVDCKRVVSAIIAAPLFIIG